MTNHYKQAKAPINRIWNITATILFLLNANTTWAQSNNEVRPWHEVIESINIYTLADNVVFPSDTNIPQTTIDQIKDVYINFILDFAFDEHIPVSAWGICATTSSILADRLSKVPGVTVTGLGDLDRVDIDFDAGLDQEKLIFIL